MKGLLISKLKFLVDEDVDARLVKLLSDKGVDIISAPKGVKNSELYELACKKQRVLLTFDKDFLNTALFIPSKLPAILVIRVHLPVLSELESLIFDFIKKFSDDTKGKTWILGKGGVEIVD